MYDEGSSASGSLRKSARVQEQEDQERSASKTGKSFKETIKFDASLYKSDDSSEGEQDDEKNRNESEGEEKMEIS